MLRDEGFDAIALSRPGRGRDWLDQQRFAHVDCDVLNQASLDRVFAEVRPDAVVNQLTAIPQNLNPRRLRSELAPTNRLRIEATKLLANAARNHGANRLISQGIAFAYAPGPFTLADEDEPLFEGAPSGFDDAVKAIQSLESTTLTTDGLRGTVLRYGHFCGPGTAYGRGGSIWTAVTNGQFPLLGDGRGQFSLVHVRDAALATVCALRSDAVGIFNIVNSTPVAVSEWLPWYARRLGARQPKSVPAWLGGLVAGGYARHLMVSQPGADNKKAIGELGWQPQYETWQACLEDGLQPDGNL